MLPGIAWLLSARLENALKGNKPFLARLPFGRPELVKFAPKFCYCAVDQEKAVLSRKRTVSRPFALLGPGMVKFAPNFSYCAVDQEKAVFSRKRTVSCPSALLGPEMVKFAPNFCYCAVDQEKAAVKRKRAVSRFLLLCRIPSKWGTPESAQKHSGKLEKAWKRSGKGSKTFRNGLGKAGKPPETVWVRPEDAEKPWARGPEMVWETRSETVRSRLENVQTWSGKCQKAFSNGLREAEDRDAAVWKIEWFKPGISLGDAQNSQNWSGSS